MNTDTEQKKNETEAAPAPSAQPAPATVRDMAATMGLGTAEPEGRPQDDEAARQRVRVNDGRLKKASEDLAAAKARIAELEAQVEKAAAAKPAFDAAAVKGFSPDPDSMDDAYAQTMAGGLNALREDVRKEVRGEVEALRSELATSREEAARRRSDETLGRAMREVEGFAPGLVARIARGDLRERWDSFLDGTDPFSGVPMRSILQGAVRDGRAEAAREVYARFVRDAGLSGQYGGVVTAPPRGAAPATPARAADGSPVYQSRDQIRSLYEKTVLDAAAGRIDPETKRKRLEELKSAIAERRFAGQ